jgi:ElaB/YqjD/DUF883 family membrane-anchored ribosome-binding protein
MNGKVNKIRWSICLVLAIPLLLVAQDMPRRFRGDPTSRPFYGMGMRGMMEAAGLRMNRRDEELPSAEPSPGEWHEISEYMKRELPNAWELYQRQPPPRQAKMKRQIFAKFQATQALRQSNQLELYSLRVQQQKLWDETEGLIKQWHAAPLDQKPAIRIKIQGKVHEAMQAVLKEQELRIKKLEQALADAKDRLAADRKDLDEVAARRSNRLLEQSPPAPEEAQQSALPTTQPAANIER